VRADCPVILLVMERSAPLIDAPRGPVIVPETFPVDS